MKTINLYFIGGLIALLGFSSCSSDKDNPMDQAVLTKLEVVQLPAKTVYSIGESLDLTGMVLKKYYSDGMSEEVSVFPSEVTGFDSSKPVKSQTLTVTIAGIRTTFTVEITDAVLESLRMKKLPDKVRYALGENLDLSGIEVVGLYNDGTEKLVSVTAADVSGFSSEEAAENLILTITKSGKKMTFSVSVEPIRIENGVLTEVSDDISELILPAGVKSIAEAVFAGKNIPKIVLNEGLEEIGEDAFFNSKVQEINFPATLKKIGKYAFYKCADLKNVDLSLTQVSVLEEGVFGLSGVADVKLPVTLKEIVAQSFLDTGSLKQITLNEGLELVGLEAFRASGLETIYVPNSIKVLDERAFYLCPVLKEVITYGSSTGAGTLDLTPQLGVSSFENCPKLTRLDIPSKIELISQNIISGNTGVTTITIPANVKKINFAAFKNTGIKQVIVKAVVPPVADMSVGIWYGFPDDLESLKVPAASVDAYKQAVGWKDYANVIVAE